MLRDSLGCVAIFFFPFLLFFSRELQFLKSFLLVLYPPTLIILSPLTICNNNNILYFFARLHNAVERKDFFVRTTTVHMCASSNFRSEFDSMLASPLFPTFRANRCLPRRDIVPHKYSTTTHLSASVKNNRETIEFYRTMQFWCTARSIVLCA